MIRRGFILRDAMSTLTFQKRHSLPRPTSNSKEDVYEACKSSASLLLKPSHIQHALLAVDNYTQHSQGHVNDYISDTQFDYRQPPSYHVQLSQGQIDVIRNTPLDCWQPLYAAEPYSQDEIDAIPVSCYEMWCRDEPEDSLWLWGF
ncbi:hypothetical protein L6452_09989 [Arctium lappa]|uniref:Uncharacterized protein n=1 Tax=Arctium lappa TaxID=4217 RepID=A0ACB9DM20_ARCLA|nr:hypothetical protein L6452_09989 [Arctium lappa]